MGAAKRAAVTESGRPLQAAIGPLKEVAVTSGRYRKRAAAMSAAVTESRRPLQEEGGGRDGGRYTMCNALRQDA